MAVLMQLMVTPATRAQFDQLDLRVGEAMSQAAGPPTGLMSHVVYPQDAGFVIADVWRTRADAETFVNGPLQSLLGEAGLTVTETAFLPVWSFARP